MTMTEAAAQTHFISGGSYQWWYLACPKNGTRWSAGNKINRKYLAHGSRIYSENYEGHPQAFNHWEKYSFFKDHCTLELEEWKKQTANTEGSNKTMTVKGIMASEFLCLSPYAEICVWNQESEILGGTRDFSIHINLSLERITVPPQSFQQQALRRVNLHLQVLETQLSLSFLRQRWSVPFQTPD